MTAEIDGDHFFEGARGTATLRSLTTIFEQPRRPEVIIASGRFWVR
ncbi:hypothetical protein [Microtetraspora malaysiensis]|nr:hypothetical protein [Microtetraspora malaysiensis]